MKLREMKKKKKKPRKWKWKSSNHKFIIKRKEYYPENFRRREVKSRAQSVRLRREKKKKKKKKNPELRTLWGWEGKKNLRGVHAWGCLAERGVCVRELELSLEWGEWESHKVRHRVIVRWKWGKDFKKRCEIVTVRVLRFRVSFWVLETKRRSFIS